MEKEQKIDLENTKEEVTTTQKETEAVTEVEVDSKEIPLAPV